MKDERVINGLIRKRAQLARQIESGESALRQMVIDLDSVCAALRLFAPNLTLPPIKTMRPAPRHAAFRGQVSRIVFGALRDKGPMTSVALAQHVMAERGFNTADTALAKTISHRVQACLRHHKKRGTLRVLRRPGQYMLWEVVR